MHGLHLHRSKLVPTDVHVDVDESIISSSSGDGLSPFRASAVTFSRNLTCSSNVCCVRQLGSEMARTVVAMAAAVRDKALKR